MLSTSFPLTASDWRGRFIWNLAEALAARSDIELALWAPHGDLPERVRAATSPAENAWLRRLAEAGGIAHALRARPFRGVLTALRMLAHMRGALGRACYDVIHVNWLQNALSLAGNRSAAVVSVLGTDYALLQRAGMPAAIRAALRGRRCVITPNANWMAPRLSELFGDLCEVRPIPFGVDPAWFELRRQPSANQPRPWLAVVRVTRAKLGPLFEWGEGLFGVERPLHLLGPMQEKVMIPTWVTYHGATNPAVLLGRWFPQAAGLVTLSAHTEGRPQVILEAMASGLPVVAADHPAHRDVLRDAETGFLVSSREQLAAALAHLDDEIANDALGAAARDWVRSEVGTWSDCAARYVAAYRIVSGG